MSRLIKLDDHAARAEPVSIGSTYTGMWGISSPTFTPKQDPLLELFKAADESLRPYLTDTVRHLVNQYESVCSKPASCLSALNSYYEKCATRMSNPELRGFFMDPTKQELRIFATKDHRKSLHRQLEGIDVTHESTGHGGRGATLVIRKKNGLSQALQSGLTQSSATLKWLRAEQEHVENAIKNMDEVDASGDVDGPLQKKARVS